MKSFVLIIVCALVAAATKPAGVMHSSTAYDEHNVRCYSEHRDPPLHKGTAVLVDSSGNCLSAWTKMQECLAYNASVEGLQFVNRGYSPTGTLNAHQTDADFSFWVDDMWVYNDTIPPIGGARYPYSCAGYDPYISFVTTEGDAVILWEQGGWFSSSWADLAEIETPYVLHKILVKQLPDSTIILIGLTLENEIMYATLSYDLQEVLAVGVLAIGNYWGYDINGGIAYVFYYDDSLNIYYRATTDGVNWSSEQTYDMMWALPYANNTLYWTQMALTDAGNPLLVYDIIDGDDATYPWNGVVGVSYQEGVPSVIVSQSDSQAFYGTIATGGNYAVVLYQLPWNSELDSFAAHDQWFNASTDNGVTWGTPKKITSSDEHTGLAQLAKRVDPAKGKFFFFYGLDLVHEYDPFFMASVSSTDPHAWYVGWQEIDVGIEEATNHPKSDMVFTALPNPFRNSVTLYLQQISKNGAALEIYDCLGKRIRRLVNLQSSGNRVVWDGTDKAGQEVSCGTYFVRYTDHSSPGYSVQKVLKVE